VQHWLLVRGTRDRLLLDSIDSASLRSHSSTRRPGLQSGDLALCYASGWQVLFAVVEVVGEPANHPGRTRWAWRIPLEPLLALPDLRHAPPVEAAGVFPRSLGRHSYIRLTPEQFLDGHEAIAAAFTLA
jgi:hypothetical protein